MLSSSELPTLTLAFIGIPEAGKTSILRRYCYNKFDERKTQGNEFDFFSAATWIDSQQIAIKIACWNTPYSEKYRNFSEIFFWNTDAVLLIVDVNHDNLEQELYTLFNLYSNNAIEKFKKIPIYIAINKIDVLPPAMRDKALYQIKQQIKFFQGDTPAIQWREPHFVSAKTNEGFDSLFETIIYEWLQRRTYKPWFTATETNQDRYLCEQQKRINAFYSELPPYYDPAQKMIAVLKELYLQGNGRWIELAKFFAWFLNPLKRKQIQQVQSLVKRYLDGEINTLEEIKQAFKSINKTLDLKLQLIEDFFHDKADLLKKNTVLPVFSQGNASNLSQFKSDTLNIIKSLSVKGWDGDYMIDISPTTQQPTIFCVPIGAKRIAQVLKAEPASTVNAKQLKRVQRIARYSLFHPNAHRAFKTDAFYAECARFGQTFNLIPMSADSSTSPPHFAVAQASRGEV